MTRKITLNVDDVKTMIAEKFGIEKKDIHFECYSSSQDGPMFQPASAFFSFEEKFVDIKAQKVRKKNEDTQIRRKSNSNRNTCGC